MVSPELSPNQTASRSMDNQPSVELRIVERKSGLVVVELTNGSGHPIYLSFEPALDGEQTKFLTYGLERRLPTQDSFEPYGESFHFIPELNALAAKSSIVFRLVHSPTEYGEYRVAVSFYDDRKIYELIRDKTPHWSAAEQEQIDRSRRIVRSDAFTVSRKSR